MPRRSKIGPSDAKAKPKLTPVFGISCAEKLVRATAANRATPDPLTASEVVAAPEVEVAQDVANVKAALP